MIRPIVLSNSPEEIENQEKYFLNKIIEMDNKLITISIEINNPKKSLECFPISTRNVLFKNDINKYILYLMEQKSLFESKLILYKENIKEIKKRKDNYYNQFIIINDIHKLISKQYKKDISYHSELNHLEKDILFQELPIKIINNNEINKNILFDPDRKKRKELWKYIKLIAPASIKPKNQLKWRTKDAIGAYCLKCNCKIPYKAGTSQQIARHMQYNHPNDISDPLNDKIKDKDMNELK